MKNKESFCSTTYLNGATMSEEDLSNVTGGSDTSGYGFSLWGTIMKPFLTKASEKSGEGVGTIIWLIPTLILTEIVKWQINKQLKKQEKKQEKRRKREKLERRRKASLANAD